MKNKHILICAIIFIVAVSLTLLCGCGGDGGEDTEDEGAPEASSAKEITAFSFPSAYNDALSSDVAGTISGTGITATVPYGIDVTGLVATFSTTGVSVAVGSTVQISGETANDFTDPVIYTVTAADGSTQEYIVTITAGTDTVPPDAPTVTVELIVNVSTPTWSWTVPAGTVTFRYQLNSESGTWLETADAATTSYTPDEALADGTHTLYVQARDSAGNWSESGSGRVVIDTTLSFSEFFQDEAGGVDGLDGAGRVAVSPDGKNVYVEHRENEICN